MFNVVRNLRSKDGLEATQNKLPLANFGCHSRRSRNFVATEARCQLSSPNARISTLVVDARSLCEEWSYILPPPNSTDGIRSFYSFFNFLPYRYPLVHLIHSM